MRLPPATHSVYADLPEPRQPWRGAVVVLAVNLLVSGCAGNVVGSLGAHDGAGGAPNGGASNAGGGPFIGNTDVLEPTGLHRLNGEEYDTTVRDLLNTKLSFKAKFLNDEFANGFDNNASALSMTRPRLQGFQLAAEALADELTADGSQTLSTLAPCTGGTAQKACLTNFVGRFSARAWRRPSTQAEVSKVVADASASGGTYAAQVKLATTAILMSPYFLYRVEIGEGREDGLLNPYELASRLSYFLWSSTPDDELTAAAADGSLLRDEVLDAQVTRMLSDRKAEAFSDRFAGMWLGVRQAEAFLPDKTVFPDFDAELQASAVAQTKATFNDLIAGKMAFHELFDGNTTYINDRLAKHYDMPAPNSTVLVKVAAGKRRGVLTQAGVLMGQSLPDRTSLVHRGAFLLQNVLCATPPGAPPNVPALQESNPNAKTQRQRLEVHATVPSCAVCHNLIDPYGFVLESYDATGTFRTLDNGGVIDTSAQLPDGTKVADVDELSAIFAKSPAVSSCLVQKVSTYAIGRTLTSADAAHVNKLHADLLKDGQRVDHLLHKLVLSPLFRRRG